MLNPTDRAHVDLRCSSHQRSAAAHTRGPVNGGRQLGRLFPADGRGATARLPRLSSLLPPQRRKKTRHRGHFFMSVNESACGKERSTRTRAPMAYRAARRQRATRPQLRSGTSGREQPNGARAPGNRATGWILACAASATLRPLGSHCFPPRPLASRAPTRPSARPPGLPSRLASRVASLLPHHRIGLHVRPLGVRMGSERRVGAARPPVLLARHVPLDGPLDTLLPPRKRGGGHRR